MNTLECLRMPTAMPPSWFDIEIPDEIAARHRFLWLGFVVLAGGCINDDGSIEHVVALATLAALSMGLICTCWKNSPLWLKSMLLLSGAALSFVHRELPMPGVGYGFLSSSMEWPEELPLFRNLAAVFGLFHGVPFVGLIVMHFCEPALTAALKRLEAWLVERHLLPARTAYDPTLKP